jgi:RNA recognition motif-containing protein
MSDNERDHRDNEKDHRDDRDRGDRGDRDDLEDRNERNSRRDDNERGDRRDDYDRRDRREANRDPPSLLVRNLSFKIRSDDLREAFSKFGKVRDVYIPEVSFFFSSRCP